MLVDVWDKIYVAPARIFSIGPAHSGLCGVKNGHPYNLGQNESQKIDIFYGLSNTSISLRPTKVDFRTLG